MKKIVKSIIGGVLLVTTVSIYAEIEPVQTQQEVVFPKIENPEEFVKKSAEDGVITVPGAAFGQNGKKNGNSTSWMYGSLKDWKMFVFSKTVAICDSF